MLKQFFSIYMVALIIMLCLCSRSMPSTYTYRLTSKVQEEITLPILMYHGITSSATNKGDYFIPQSTFESDLKYLSQNGYKTISATQLINFAEGKLAKDKLPKKPILLAFDDGFCNNYNLAWPLLKRYNSNAIISVIGVGIDAASNTEYRKEDMCSVTWKQLKEMSQSPCWEIGNHTYDMHYIKNGRKGISRKPNESTSNYKKIIISDIGKLQRLLYSNTGAHAEVFAWPYGFNSPEATPWLKKLGIKITMTCYEGHNTIISGNPDTLFDLKRYLRSPNRNIAEILP